MKTRFYLSIIKSGLLICLVAFLLPLSLQAQKMKHSPAGGGGGNRQAVSKPAAKPKGAINGGNQSKAKSVKSSGNNISAGNKTNISTGNKTNISGNKVNIDNSKKNVNVNVDNSKNVNVHNNRNTVVRHNSRPYNRPPYRYGGRSYYCYHPYHYHPYRPFYWGPVWHPWGFFITTLAVTAVVVSVESQQYHYDQGVWYQPYNGGYQVIAAPVGGTITTLPPGSQTINNSNSNNTTTNSNNTTVVNNYYYGGTYYEKSSGGYTVVPPTAGMVVENLPEGGEETKIGDVTYVKVGETYYQPIDQDGKNMYEVVEIKED